MNNDINETNNVSNNSDAGINNEVQTQNVGINPTPEVQTQNTVTNPVTQSEKKNKTSTVIAIIIIVLAALFCIYWFVLKDKFDKKTLPIVKPVQEVIEKDETHDEELSLEEEVEDEKELESVDDLETKELDTSRIGKIENGHYYCYDDEINDYYLADYYWDDEISWEEAIKLNDTDPMHYCYYDLIYDEKIQYGNLKETYYLSLDEYIEFYDNNTYKYVAGKYYGNGTYKINKNKYILSNEHFNYIKTGNYLVSSQEYNHYVYMSLEELESKYISDVEAIKKNILSDNSVLGHANNITKLEVLFDGYKVDEINKIDKAFSNHNYDVSTVIKIYSDDYPGPLACVCYSDFFSFASGASPECAINYYLEQQTFVFSKNKIVGLAGFG